MRLSQIANLTRNLGCEPLHDRKWSLDQRQSKLNYDSRTQAAWTYASQRQPASHKKNCLALYPLIKSHYLQVLATK